MITTFFTADTHFNHENILKFTPRPFSSIDEHDEELIENINSRVGKRDVLYHLGDFCFAPTARKQTMLAKEILSKIKCKNIHLIVGNHDPRVNSGQPREDFAALFKTCTLYHLVRIPETNNPEDVNNVTSRKLILNHYALRTWEGMHGGSYHLYGHSHNTLPENGSLSFDVGIDSVASHLRQVSSPESYHPLTSFEVCDRLMKRPIKTFDGDSSAPLVESDMLKRLDSLEDRLDKFDSILDTIKSRNIYP